MAAGELKPKFIFVGTGVSTAVPVLTHALDAERLKKDNCACVDALKPGSRNRRNNVSAILRVPVLGDSGAEYRNVLIDAGKTFRDAALTVLMTHGIATLDALLLTHDHADAILGLDELRDLQKHDMETLQVSTRIPTYLSETTFTTVKRVFPYIVDASTSATPVARKVTQLDFHVIPDDPSAQLVPFKIASAGNVEVTPLPVYHGGTYICFGFAFGNGPSGRFVYLSDVNEIPGPVFTQINEQPTSVLVVDCLHKTRLQNHFSHFCWPQALQAIRDINPVRAYLVGMFCDVEYERSNTELKEWVKGLPEGHRIQTVECAYDGLVLELEL
eukprot:TRINITY_DN80445_c0_g1_i1.p1 TRINITY_DN80445_c0_g1~~TRINITY_DN80445_c0_g1_i1.p1  ORF type:complete len:338 (-),score=51.88 TRINITY_DN80445_c0_g1_i1:18-1004(-)